MITLGDKVFLKFDNSQELCRHGGKAYIYESMENALRYMTTPERNMGYIVLEYRPVLHGRWIQCGTDDQENCVYECTVCHKTSIDPGCFCTSCGSEMDVGPDKVIE